MKRIAIMLGTLVTVANAANALDGEVLLSRVDERRAVGQSFRFDIKIEDYENGVLVQSATMSGNAKGANKTLVEYLEPANMRGKKLLMVDDETFFFAPKTKRPVRLTASQRLMGQASNGDVMSVRFGADYTPTIEGEDIIDSESGPVECLTLRLVAKRTGTAYGAMKLWVAKAGNFPVKAECYAASGKLLKTVEYGRIRTMGEKEIVTRAILRDKIAKDAWTVIDFLDMTEAEIPDAFFTKEYLSRM